MHVCLQRYGITEEKERKREMRIDILFFIQLLARTHTHTDT